MNERTDEEIVSAWQAGDSDAFDELVDRFHRRVFGICFRYFGDSADAEEATQEAFIVLYRRGSSFKGQARFSTWLYRVTTNVCHDLARKSARRPTTVSWDAAPGGAGGSLPGGAGRTYSGRAGGTYPGGTPDTATAVEDALEAAEWAADLKTALRALDAHQREAVVLHDVYGYSYEDIAERTCVAVGTVKSRVHRGHARLAARLRHLRTDDADRERFDANEHLTE